MGARALLELTRRRARRSSRRRTRRRTKGQEVGVVVAFTEMRGRRAGRMEGSVGTILVSLELILKRGRGRRTGGRG